MVRQEGNVLLHLTSLRWGNTQVALATAASDEAMSIAQDADTNAWNSGGDTTYYYIKTWVELHEAHWDGLRRPQRPVVPLTLELIHVVGALV